MTFYKGVPSELVRTFSKKVLMQYLQKYRDGFPEDWVLIETALYESSKLALINSV